jgi:hypothetical protein
MNEIQKFYKELIYRNYNPDDGYINYRYIQQKGGAKSLFTQDIDELIKNTMGKPDVYHGMTIRKKKNGRKNNCIYGDCLFIDIDFHDYQVEAHEELKNKVIDIIADDMFLSQVSAIVDSGRGLHLYYLLPEKTYTDTLKLYMSRLIYYCEGVYFIQDDDVLDRRVKDVSRILRVPGSINSKIDKESKLLICEPEPIDKDFMNYLKTAKSPGSYRGKFSVMQAMELCDYEPTIGRNVECPFPGHEDDNPSFRYFEENDTFWCFKCSPKKKYYDGIHFLTLMERTDLIPKLRAEVVVSELDNHKLDENGRLWRQLKDGEKILADFMSSKKIEVQSITHGRRVYIDLDDSVVEITDYPTNREIKKRYLQTNREFLIFGSESGFSDMLSRFIMKADTINKSVIFNHGLNQYKHSKPIYYINGQALPTQDNRPAKALMEFSSDKDIPSKRPDIGMFLEALEGDSNISHIVGFLWGIATLAKDIFIKRAGMFPMLVATGTRETGKTLLARMVTNMFGYERNEELDTTPFAMIRKLERYGTMPVHFDEFGNKRREVEHEELLKDLSTSPIVIRERGNTAQSTDKYIMQCPVIITGEKNVVDAGIVSRAIILNLGKTAKKNYACFERWIDFTRDGSLLKWFMGFIEKHLYSYRKYIENCELTRERSKVKEDIMNQTITYIEKYCEDFNYQFKKEAIKGRIQDTQIYQDSITVDGYTEILADVLSDNFDPDISPTTNYKISSIMDSFYFSLEHGFILVNMSELFNMYKICVKDSYRRIPSISEFKINFIQAPDMIGYIKNRKRLYIHDKYNDRKKEKRLHNTIVLKLSNHNYDYMRNVLLYKMLPEHEKDITKLYHEVERVMDNMSAKCKNFVDNQGSYTVL